MQVGCAHIRIKALAEPSSVGTDEWSDRAINCISVILANRPNCAVAECGVFGVEQLFWQKGAERMAAV